MIRSGDIDLPSPVEWDHPDNAGLALLLLGLPGVAGGPCWPDLTGKTAGAVLSGGPAWVATATGSAGLRFDGSTGSASFAYPGGERYPFGNTGLAHCAAAFWWHPAAWPAASDPTSGGPLTLGGDTSLYPYTDGVTYLSLFTAGRVDGIASLYPAAVPRRVFCHAAPGGRWRLYENGRLCHDIAHPTAYVDLGSAPALGYGGTTAYRANGTVSDLRVWVASKLPPADGMAARDFAGAIDLARDPRLRHLSRTAYLFAAGGGGGGPAFKSYLRPRPRLVGAC